MFIIDTIIYQRFFKSQIINFICRFLSIFVSFTMYEGTHMTAPRT
jgi:hypothetical protein